MVRWVDVGASAGAGEVDMELTKKASKDEDPCEEGQAWEENTSLVKEKDRQHVHVCRGTGATFDVTPNSFDAELQKIAEKKSLLFMRDEEVATYTSDHISNPSSFDSFVVDSCVDPPISPSAADKEGVVF